MLVLDAYFVFCTTTGEPFSDHHLANGLASNLLLACDFLVLHDSQSEYHRPALGEGKYHDLPWWKRLLWAADLASNVRGIGWNWEAVKAHPARPSDSAGRGRFVLRQAARWAAAYLIKDLTGTLFRKRAAMHAGGSVFADGPLWTAVYVGAWYGNLCAGMVLSHAFLAGASVGMGVSRPSEWPGLYGGVHQAYSMRRFWGRAWHDLFRRFLTSNSQYLSRTLLGLKKGSRLLPYVELYLAFLLSGAVHWVGTYAMLREHTAPALTVLFFVLQAVVITLEDFLVALGTRWGIKDSWRVRALGYVWVAGWIVLLTPVRTEPLIRAGFFDKGEERAFSVVQGVWEGEWHPGYERGL
ncbi:hypothetical protein CALCODRAFT_443354 [Calocera cornea HHB12733]|uniref:Wax synthase domain-containing protein n=1 Tax=Calocera cornea HHB12733 TaxID=1353952 RepID=A0A165CRH8_9BASI|nr:hypothetical protein CALCODRAFT_443354 [Calocera cornea HHB12733]